MITNKQSKFIFLGVLVSFSSIFYLKGITTSIFLQPTIYFFIILCITSLIVLIYKKTINSSLVYFLFLALILFSSLISQTFFIIHKNGLLNELGRVIYPIIVSILSYYLLSKIKRKLPWKVLINTTIILLLLDTIVRLYFAGHYFVSFENRYVIKGPGLLFIDPNFTGFIAASIFLLLDKFKEVLNNLKFYKVTLLIIVLYSMSYSVFISLLFALFVKYTLRYRILKILTLFIMPFLFLYLFDYVSNDGSMITKLKIINLSFDYIITQNIYSLLVGIGHGNFAQFFDETNHGAHNLIGMSIEGGFIFIFINIIIYLFFYKNSSNKFTIIFILLSGFISLYPMAYMSVIFILLLFNEKRDLQLNKEQI